MKPARLVSILCLTGTPLTMAVSPIPGQIRWQTGPADRSGDAVVVCAVAGEVDCNGVLDMNDSAALADVLLGMDTDPSQMAAADMNGDASSDGGDIPMSIHALIAP